MDLTDLGSVFQVKEPWPEILVRGNFSKSLVLTPKLSTSDVC